MARRHAIAMNERTVIELRAYLRKVKRESIPEFDDFLKEVETFAKLRLEAEDGYMRNRHLAKNKRHALPLDWYDISLILNPDKQTPEVSLVTEVVNICLNEVEAIVQDLRKVLIRQREKVSLGLVQQVDSHCLRWLSKQPGRDSVEKAGVRQHILAVVRRESYNTLENRVFKDFVMRIHNPCANYLKRNEPTFKEVDIVKRVRRLFVLCGESLSDPILSDIGDLKELPHPNYVLRQEWRYAKVWKAYCRIIRHAGIAERLWLNRHELGDTLSRLRTAVPRHISPRAMYHSPIWFNDVEGKNDLLDKPFYENKEGSTNTLPCVNDIANAKDVVIDLTGSQPCRDLLIYGRHENAKPYLQNYDKPSIEDLGGKHHYFLRDILKASDREEPAASDRDKLHDYFEQLHALVGGERWFILVPDNWKANWQEAVIKSAPLPRNRVFLLWRSVAAVIGSVKTLKNSREADTITVIDIQQGGLVGLSKLTLALEDRGGGLIPQRKSYVRHRALYSQVVLEPISMVPRQNAILKGSTPEYALSGADLVRLKAFAKDSNHVVFIDSLNLVHNGLPPDWVIAHKTLLERGTQLFIELRDAGKIAYYDELEALSLIVQTNDERIEARKLVEANEKSPGGMEVLPQPILQAATLKRQSDYVDLVLCMGDATPDAPLKIKRHSFNKSLEEDHSIDLVARITPGQGMAVVTVSSDFLQESIELDFLHGMTDKGKSGRTLTMATLEDEMERSFPPDSPDVVSDYSLWVNVRGSVKQYMDNKIAPDGDWFAKAKRLYPDGAPLPKNASPLERLIRKNVFGNDPAKSLPIAPAHRSFIGEFDSDALFDKLASDYKRAKHDKTRDNLARLIAWTYQSHYPAFNAIKKQAVNNIMSYAYGQSSAPQKQEYTLCANMCSDVSEWSQCLQAIFYRISDHNNKVQSDFYLLYNLLQFHPTILRDTGIANSDACWKWVQHIPHWYQDSRNGGGVTSSYILKSILYFLRCRRFDGKVFLTKERDRKRYDIISECLSYSVNPTQEKLRCMVIQYLNNKGTIDGLPVD